MRVLFFNRSYHPDEAATGQLLTELAEDLVREHGFEVCVITGPVAGQPVRETLNGVDVVRIRSTRLKRSGFAGRFTNYISYFLGAWWHSLWLGRVDIVVALTDPPIIGLVGWLTAKRAGAKFVFLCQDVFPEVARLLEDFRSETINGVLQHVNRFIVARADRVVALGDTMKERLVEGKGAPAEKVTVIHNWADGSRITPAPKPNPFSTAHGLDGKFVVMHSGNMGLSQNLDTLLDAASELRHLEDLVFVLVGAGVRRAHLEEETVRRGLTNVRFLPYQPKDQLRDSFGSADVFIISLARGLSGYIVPSKLYGILAAGRPFVAAVESSTEVASVARDHECGLVIEPGDSGGMVHEITRLYRDRELVERLGDNARRASGYFDRPKQVGRYRDLFVGELRDARARADAALEAGS